MADGIDATMKADEPVARSHPPDRAVGNPDRQELMLADATPLMAGDLGNPLVPVADHCNFGAHPEHFHEVCTAWVVLLQLWVTPLGNGRGVHRLVRLAAAVGHTPRKRARCAPN